MIPSLVNEALAGPYHLYSKREPRYRFRWHYHAECELFVPLAGQGECMVGDFHGQYAPQQAFLLPPMLPHCFHTLGPTVPGSPQRCYVLFFRLDSALLGALAHEADLRALHTRWPGGVRLTPADAASLIRCLDRMRDTDGLTRSAAFIDLLALLLACRNGEPLAREPGSIKSRPQNTPHRMNVIGAFLHEHCAEPIALPEIAKAAGMSVPSLCRFFKHNTGKSVFAYLQELRISRVCRQLGETSDPITDIALNSGYQTISHFNRTFKGLKGVSPRTYRAQLAARRHDRALSAMER